VPGAPQQDQLRGERAYSWQRLEQSQRLRIRQRPAGVRVERVTPAWPGLRPDRHAGFLERQQVAFDRAGGDFEPFGQIICAHQSRRPRAQLVDECIQPIGPVHAGTVARNAEISAQAATRDAVE